MKRIAKKTREQAALICAIAASNPEFAEAYSFVAVHLGHYSKARQDAYELALAAWSQNTQLGRPYVDAEAEALLRTGWEP